jgi:ribosomal protein S18 acetylase RimI-like enzyme
MVGIELSLVGLYDAVLTMGAAELVTGVASGTVLAGLGYGSNKLVGFIKEYLLNRKYNLSGEYLTTYEDNQRGARVVVKAIATLKQKGKTITGKTGETVHGQADRKEWELKASVVRDRYITGYYANVDILQHGIGTFFLKIENNLDLEGSWSGYDEENNQVSSGKYVFRKTVPVQIRNIKRSEYNTVLNLGSGYLGDGYVLGLLHEERYETLVAEYNGEVVGFVSFGLLDQNDVPAPLFSELINKDHGLRKAHKGKGVYLLVSACVEKKWRGRGIGVKLLKEAIGTIRARKPSFILSMAWKYDGKVHSEGMLIQQGFEQVKEIQNFWKQFSEENNAKCPICGIPCTCSAVVYRKRL